MKNLSIVVAITQDFAIGIDNDLLVHIPGDLRRFKEITTGHPIIMGRKTLLSLPKWPLPNRRNMVLTGDKNADFNGCDVFNSPEGVLEAIKDEHEAFIIGGGKVYEEFLPYVEKLYLTIVHQSFKADTFFPKIKWEQWNEVEREDVAAGVKSDFAYSYVTLVRK